jgi:uncharacterized protein YecT (DUF1311 family)
LLSFDCVGKLLDQTTNAEPLMSIALTMLSLTMSAAVSGGTAAPPSCSAEILRDARSAFQALYGAKKFARAVSTLEPVLSACETSLSPELRARILSDLAIAAFHGGDKKRCLAFIDRVPGGLPSSSNVAFAIENNRRLCAGEGPASDVQDCRRTETTDAENLCADAVREGSHKQLKRVLKAAEDQLRATAKNPINVWGKELLRANQAWLKLVGHDCGPLFRLEFGPWGTAFNSAQAECESSLIKQWTQELQNHFALPGHGAEAPGKIEPCSAPNAFECPAVREAEKKRETRAKAKIAEKPQTYEGNELTAAQQIADWRNNIRLHEKLWLAWREDWCVSSLAAEMAARSSPSTPPIDAQAACLVGVSDALSPSEKADPGNAKVLAVSESDASCAPLPPNSGLRFDGLYQAEPPASEAGSQHPWVSYLRFYLDGAVLVAASDGGPQKVARWLERSHKDYPPGCATADSGRVRIVKALPGGKGRVEYDGRVKGTDLLLHVENRSNGHRADEIYHFAPVLFGSDPGGRVLPPTDGAKAKK